MSDDTAPDEREKIPFSEAMELVNQGEIGLIERHYTKLHGHPQHFGGEGDNEMSPMATMAGVIWAMEKRRLGKDFDWADVEAMSFKATNDYFAAEPIDIDPEEPDSASGKDDTPGMSPPESEPSSAPY